MQSGNNTHHHFLSNIMVVDLDVLCLLMKYRILDDEDSGLIVIMYG